MNKDFKVIDLTHTIHSDIPGWDGDCGFSMSIKTDYKDCTPPDIFRTNQINMGLGTGTHMDSPAHAIPNGITIDNLDINNLVTGCVVIDVSKIADENYKIMPEVVEEFEKRNGEIPSNSFVIFYTGWDKNWEDKKKYHNNHNFPSVDENTAKLLIERNIAGLGIDTLSADTGKNGFPVHNLILGDGKYLVENIANAKDVPETGAKILVLPMKIKDAAEAPIRLIALI
jgi:kynurenine formamidase